MRWLGMIGIMIVFATVATIVAVQLHSVLMGILVDCLAAIPMWMYATRYLR